LIRTFLRDNGLTSVARYTAVFDAWTKGLGPAFQKRAVPVRFRSGELVVEVDSSAHLQELANFTGEVYRAKANEHLGKEAIRKVVFKLKS
jgi:hypothetical protein